MPLHDKLQGVNADSPTADDNLDPADVTPTPSPDEGNESGQGQAEGEDGKGRTIENVYHELSRKQNRFQTQIQTQLTELAQELRGAVTPPSQPAETGNELDRMSIDQLRSMRGTVPAEQRDALEDYIAQRMLKEGITQEMQNFRQVQQREMVEREANEQAVRMFPELKDPDSDFYHEVNSLYLSWGAAAENDPRAVLNAASQVALRNGIKPADQRGGPSPRPVKRAAPGRATAPADNALPEERTVSDEEHATISDKLKHALPKGKKFSEDVKPRTEEYRKHQNLFIS